ncbi:hypothetical protein BpHYR1_029382 [Brachionus plicatilis]|uniref:Uncharacterized protein n=1 Tax=Brachionus plicatilis TaxID=10195 RepID=A0A3M7PAC3_BRAPC|nr:hypothetical protein BpHYR1_029382 [Brachionus plicatilis]
MFFYCMTLHILFNSKTNCSTGNPIDALQYFPLKAHNLPFTISSNHSLVKIIMIPLMLSGGLFSNAPKSNKRPPSSIASRLFSSKSLVNPPSPEQFPVNTVLRNCPI